ncbi:hypothetical protein EDC04DRAFT_2911527 [Pisolithus marmoratus]|nr:hypothetical protein EDC04DRAFT_2911527 [Pisolithus marmoratus]
MSQPLRISCTAFELLFCGSNINEADIELRSAKDVEYIELIIPGCRRSIQQQSTKLFREEFPQPLMIQGKAFSFSVYRKKWYSSFIPAAINEIKINVCDVLSNSREQKFQAVHRELDITIGLSPNSPSVDATPTRITPALSNINGLRPTTDELLNQCPRFRILVIGQSGVGKSTLINKAFGIEKASSESLEPGKADIEEELISPQNDRFVLHDSKGFEPADNVNSDAVKLFIEDRKKREYVKDQLHAVWLCFRIPIPGHGDRLLEDGAETFLKTDTNVLRDIPTIVVFTKYDKLLTYMEMQKAMRNIEVDPNMAANEYLQEHCFNPIAKFTGGTDISYVAVSFVILLALANPGLEQGRKELINLTYGKVAERFKFQTDMPSPVPVVTQMAQRTLPHLKIEGSIDVGRWRYWRTLTSSGNFKDHTITECLAVIHTDIVRVWNFNDPSQYLYSDEFRGLMAKLAGTVDGSTPESPRLARANTTDVICTSPLILIAPLILPFEAGLNLVQWARETYQQLPNVHHKFMAYILDLVHVLEILFTLTATNNEKNLTRGAIRVAFNAYYDSEMRRSAHKQIKDFDFRIPGPDPVLQEIISLVRMSPTNNDHISGILQSISPEDLARDDGWRNVLMVG